MQINADEFDIIVNKVETNTIARKELAARSRLHSEQIDHQRRELIKCRQEIAELSKLVIELGIKLKGKQ